MPEKMRIIFINLMCVLNSGANFEIVLLLKNTLLKKFFQAQVLYLSESLGSASSYFFCLLAAVTLAFPRCRTQPSFKIIYTPMGQQNLITLSLRQSLSSCFILNFTLVFPSSSLSYTNALLLHLCLVLNISAIILTHSHHLCLECKVLFGYVALLCQQLMQFGFKNRQS